MVAFDPVAQSFASADNGKPARTYAVTCYAGLKAGRGVLALTGSGMDAGKAAELRETLTIRRNLLEVLGALRAQALKD